jgi:hypothetical protein
MLVMNSETHYTLTGPSRAWRFQIWPGNCHLRGEKIISNPPFLTLPKDWNIGDVILAVIKLKYDLINRG